MTAAISRPRLVWAQTQSNSVVSKTSKSEGPLGNLSTSTSSTLFEQNTRGSNGLPEREFLGCFRSELMHCCAKALILIRVLCLKSLKRSSCKPGHFLRNGPLHVLTHFFPICPDTVLKESVAEERSTKEQAAWHFQKN